MTVQREVAARDNSSTKIDVEARVDANNRHVLDSLLPGTPMLGSASATPAAIREATAGVGGCSVFLSMSKFVCEQNVLQVPLYI